MKARIPCGPVRPGIWCCPRPQTPSRAVGRAGLKRTASAPGRARSKNRRRLAPLLSRSVLRAGCRAERVRVQWPLRAGPRLGWRTALRSADTGLRAKSANYPGAPAPGMSAAGAAPSVFPARRALCPRFFSTTFSSRRTGSSVRPACACPAASGPDGGGRPLSFQKPRKYRGWQWSAGAAALCWQGIRALEMCFQI